MFLGFIHCVSNLKDINFLKFKKMHPKKRAKHRNTLIELDHKERNTGNCSKYVSTENSKYLLLRRSKQ